MAFYPLLVFPWLCTGPEVAGSHQSGANNLNTLLFVPVQTFGPSRCQAHESAEVAEVDREIGGEDSVLNDATGDYTYTRTCCQGG